MGVRGLTTFVNENEKDLFDVTYLHDTPIVVDGSGTMFYLAGFYSSPSPVCQEYSTLAVVIRDFVMELRHCGVSPYFMFDGPSTIEKRDKVLNTLDGNVKALEEMFYGDGEQRLLPPYTLQTMIQVLKDLHVPYVMSLDDADAELAALANKLNCPVLADDSDFLIFDVKEGYVPLLKLKWRGNAKNGKKEMRCLKSSALKLSSFSHVSVTKLPFLSMLLGNDWVPMEVFKSKVYGFSRKFGISKSRFTWRVESVIEWLQPLSRKRDEFIFDLLQRSLPYVDMEKHVERMRYSFDIYQDLPDVTDIWRMMQRDSNPNWVREQNLEFAVRTSLVHFSTYHLLTENLVCLPSAIVSDTKKLSPHTPSIDIRQCAYRLLLRRFCPEGETAQVLRIEEYDMVNVAYEVARGWNIYTAVCPLCESRHEFNETCIDASPGILNTSMMVFRILGDEGNQPPSFSSYCDGKLNDLFDDVVTSDFRLRLDIVFLSTIYWIKKTNPKPVYIMSLIIDFAIFINFYIMRQKNTAQDSGTGNCQQAATSGAREIDNGRGVCFSENSRNDAVLSERRKDVENNGSGETMSGGIDTNAAQMFSQSQKLSGDSDETSQNAEDGKSDAATEKPGLLGQQQPTALINSNQQNKASNDSAETAKSAEEMEKSREKIFLGPQWMKKATSQKAQSVKNQEEVKKSEVESDQANKSGSSSNEKQSAVVPPTEKFTTVARKKYCHILNLLAPPPPVKSLIPRPNRIVYQWMIFVEKFPIDLELLHSGAEWSCAAFAVFMLYQAIEYDETNLGINDIFGSNMALHEINARLHKIEGLDVTKDLQHISSMVLKSLESEPAVKHLVEIFVNYLLLVQK